MNDIKLRSSFSYWIIKNIPFFIILGAITYFHDMASGSPVFTMGIFAVAVCLTLYLFYNFISSLLFTKWIVTVEQIKIYRGVFLRTIDYIELYRIYDYQEKRNILQVITNNSTIVIYSGDKSHPVLVIPGIPRKGDTIQNIRSRVEQQKTKKGIYEFTNR